jgi:hypothetical protein
LLQRKKEKDNRHSVKHHIGKVVPACVQPVQLRVEHVRDRGQRMPILGMNVSECPTDVGEGNAAGDPGVLIDVARIVVINEIEPQCLIKDRPY